ncbi:MAG: ATP-binding protein, partial [Actinomycetota bacterium]|nr:ATP-binding protein [Actinomycetota bacterium]
GAQDLAAARQFVSAQAATFGLVDNQIGDVALVVTELITNSIEHGAGQARLRVWTDGSRLLCEVFDKGWFSDRLAGLRPAPADQPHGRGLLLVNSLADLVTLHVDEHGTAIRAHFGRGRGE